jgi:hypothetical protein
MDVPRFTEAVDNSLVWLPDLGQENDVTVE